MAEQYCVTIHGFYKGTVVIKVRTGQCQIIQPGDIKDNDGAGMSA